MKARRGPKLNNAISKRGALIDVTVKPDRGTVKDFSVNWR